MKKGTPRFEEQDLDRLVEALRHELQEYGGLFNLLSQQREGIAKRNPDNVLSLNEKIDAQTRFIAELRGRREEIISRLNVTVGNDAPESLCALILHFPEPARLLFEALISDINGIVARNLETARKNQTLLSSAMKLTEQTLHVLETETFSDNRRRCSRGMAWRKWPAAVQFR